MAICDNGVCDFLPPQYKLIPTELLFGHIQYASPLISPDGLKLAYLKADEHGNHTMNLWVRDLNAYAEGQENAERQVTYDRKRSVINALWPAGNSGKLLCFRDKDGVGLPHLYAVDLATLVIRDLTPFERSAAGEVTFKRNKPDEALITMNLRDAALMDLYRVNLTSGATELVMENPGFVSTFIPDENLNVRAIIALNIYEQTQALLVKKTKPSESEGTWKELIAWKQGEHGSVVEFDEDGNLYVLSNKDRSSNALLLVDGQTGETLKEMSAPEHDIVDILMHPVKQVPQAVGYVGSKVEWEVVDPSFKSMLRRFEKLHPDAEVRVGKKRSDLHVLKALLTQTIAVSRDDEEMKWVVHYRFNYRPSRYYLYDHDLEDFDLLFEDMPALTPYKMAKRASITIRARDGLEMPAFLTLPPFKEATNLPIVLAISHGPGEREQWGYNALAQWLADRGYGCLQVNLRGSDGDDTKRGIEGVQHDLTDAVQWVIKKGIADPKQVALFGIDYFGGYAALAGMAFTPELYACAIATPAVNNLKLLFESIPEEARKTLTQVMGNLTDEFVNRKVSPLFHANSIRAPMLLAHADGDGLVSMSETFQMVQTVREKGIPVEYVIYLDEGQGVMKQENTIDLRQRVEQFLAKHLKAGRTAKNAQAPQGTTAFVVNDKLPNTEHQ
ncbi:S9 family peptidase [Balamuthia mandrillaris]